MAAWFVWAVRSLPILAAWYFGMQFPKNLGHSTKFMIRLYRKCWISHNFPIILGFNVGHGAFFHQAAKEYVWFWDMKSVSIQAAYYMEWRGPRFGFVLYYWMTTARGIDGSFSKYDTKGITAVIAWVSELWCTYIPYNRISCHGYQIDISRLTNYYL